MTVFLSIILIVVLLISLFFFFFKNATFGFMKPNTDAESINKIKRFLEFDFGEQYEITNHESRNYHSDRPLTISILLTEESFAKLQAFVSKRESGLKEYFNNEKTIVYKEEWIHNADGATKNHFACHISSNLNRSPFFSARLFIDFNQKTLIYRETGL